VVRDVPWLPPSGTNLSERSNVTNVATSRIPNKSRRLMGGTVSPMRLFKQQLLQQGPHCLQMGWGP
jgi:hypothetical protein